MTDLVEDGHDGLLTIPGDASSLLLALTSLCRDVQLRHRLGSAAQEKMKRFTWTRSARRHESVFFRALGIKPAPSVLEVQSPQNAPYSGKAVLN